jgi:hypothetical protein
VTERELRSRLRHDPVPEEAEAGERTWRVVRAAYAERERLPWIERRSRLVLVLALLAALAVASVTPPGRAVVQRVADRVAGRSPSQPALVQLPTSGRLLVLSSSGAWVVHEDGSKRFLGEYEDASWSRRGLYVVASEGNQLVTLQPETGDVRWSLSRAEQIRDPRWSGGGLDTRIAYRAGSALHVVAGDGSPDAVVAADVSAVAPAWRGDSHVLAYAGRDNRAHILDVDARRELWSTPGIPGIHRLTFSRDGYLVVFTRRNAQLVGRRGVIRKAAAPSLANGHVLLDAIALGSGRVLYADYDPHADRTAFVLAHCFAPGPCLAIGPGEVFRAPGRIGNFTLSPDARWLAAGWPAADQLLFFRLFHFNKVTPVSHVGREFQPGGRAHTFPRLMGWAPKAP